MCARDEPCSSPINPFRTAVSNVIQACHVTRQPSAGDVRCRHVTDWSLSVLEPVSFACYPLASESGTIGIAGACLVGSGRFFLHVPTHCTGSNVYVHESARGARDVARSMSGVAGHVSRARRYRRQG